ncbi:MAG: TonB-dependent receptor, partial [Polyangiaceae bacterium]|nr:TonB-dependent receptor [Polyangiaceae bacterium]
GTNFYWSEPTVVEDIERIEVIRGPASALYGANAFSGVINIITREPGSDPGTHARIGIGNLRQVHGHVSNSGGVGGLTYRIGASYDQSLRYTREITDETIGRSYAIEQTDLDFRTARATGHLRYTFKPELYADLQGGYSDGLQTVQTTGLFREFQFDQTTANTMATLQTPWGYIRGFWNRVKGETGATGVHHLTTTPVANTVDIEATIARQFHLVVDHNLYIGGAYRLKMIDWDMLDEDHLEHHSNGFAQDTMRVSDWLILVGSFRIDRHPLLEQLQISPRGAIVIQPTDGQALRVSVGRAFRTQTFLESYVSAKVPTPLLAVTADALGSEINERLDEKLRPERIISSEVGYRFAESKYFDVDVAAYYNI